MRPARIFPSWSPGVGKLDQRCLVARYSLLMDLRKTVNHPHNAQHGGADPADYLQQVPMLLGQVSPMPDWFVMKHPVAQPADSVQPSQNIRASANLPGDVGKNFPEYLGHNTCSYGASKRLIQNPRLDLATMVSGLSDFLSLIKSLLTRSDFPLSLAINKLSNQ
jgi:hypothetical protein